MPATMSQSKSKAVPAAPLPTATQLKVLTSQPRGGKVSYTPGTTIASARVQILDAKGNSVKSDITRAAVDACIKREWLEPASAVVTGATVTEYRVSPKGRKAIATMKKIAS